MTAKMFTTVAAGAIFATASVFAPAAFAQSATQPADNSAPAMKMAPAATATAPAATADSAATGSYLTAQSPDQVSANTYIGQSVYNGNNESIGKVTDLIMQKQGGIVAAVVGVGGFLGIGQKNVAVPIGNVTVAQNTQDGTVKLTTSETVDTLKAAPEFKTLEMQSAEKAPTNSGTGMAPATDNTSTGSTTNN
jgi:sporulation protein YlmC with PRC-barrel domain